MVPFVTISGNMDLASQIPMSYDPGVPYRHECPAVWTPVACEKDYGRLLVIQYKFSEAIVGQ